MKERFWLVAIFILAFVLRIIYLRDFPAGFTADEAAQGYTAYSILKTGKDEWGVKFPFNPRSFGDFKAPLYTYLSIPSIAFLGLNEFAVRLPNAVLGSLVVIVAYLFTKELLVASVHLRGVHSYTSEVSLLASLLLAISPWHISLSRGAFEANLTTFFLPLAVLLFLCGLRKPWFIIPSSLIFGLNLFTYHSAKILTPLILISLVLWKREKLKGEFLKHIYLYVNSVVIFGLFFLLSFYSFLMGGGARVSDIGLFSGGWQNVAEQRFFAVSRGLPDFIARIFNNKLTFLTEEFLRNYFSYLSPQFLFTQGAGEATYGMISGRGVLYLIELPFLIVSFYFLLKEKQGGLRFLWFWVLVSPIPASLARGVGYHANRVAVMVPAIQVLSAYGMVRLLDLSKKFKTLNIFFCFSVFLLSFIFFLEDYFFQAPKINAPKMSYGWRQAINYLNIQKGVKKIIISQNFSEPQAFVMFYGKIDPLLVQPQTKSWLEYQKSGWFVDQLGKYSLGNYEFRNFSFPEDWEEKDVILVGMEKDFLGQEKILLEKIDKGQIKEEKVISYPDGSSALRIIKL